ncbi:molybdopterin-guanine dinucleotide biosynthesis protein A [Halogranum amylolyticum]|uniref:Probable molybdenum cofactor guanylyltransferase n=1 Tax=Halogranum amylolyticum TaxID=660520 RepID=A0A1H8VZT4_9EURY|nr:molybdenum cofactor guanylyltransferase [Halogranum amylolyticum]SEP20886.1 molybdopterin-guanine dinucleotide biosynthesis protein A [Halogranum amylolyticum]
MRSAVVIAGGRSTRFGDADKAVARLAGTPMIRRVADRLAAVVDELVVNCRVDQRAAIEAAMADYPLSVRFALDDDTDEGPMAGIGTGLAACEGEYAVVVACDMPFVDPDVVAYLFERAEDEGVDAAVPKLDDGWYQTTQAVYRTEAMATACENALARGDRKILAPLEELEWLVVDEAAIDVHGDLDTFENLNTREEFADAQSRF